MKNSREILILQIIKEKERDNKIREELRGIKNHITKLEETGEDSDAAGYTYRFGTSAYITFEL